MPTESDSSPAPKVKKRRFDSIHRKFKKQTYHAKKRGIAWELSYFEWLDIWHASGHFAERGTTRGKYVMARHGDVGPYAVDNVSIVRVEDNNSASAIAVNERKWGPAELRPKRVYVPRPRRPRPPRAPETIEEELRRARPKVLE